jgi:ProP effector
MSVEDVYMSNGRDQLKNFSLLKSLIKSNVLKERTDMLIKTGKNNEDLLINEKNIYSNKKDVSKTKYSEDKIRVKIPQYKCNKNIQTTHIINSEKNDFIYVTIDLKNQHAKEEEWYTQWLQERFPKCFNKKNKLPLKVGISNDIEIIGYYEQPFLIDNNVLHRVIKNYVQDSRYQMSILKYKKRFDLDGRITEHCTDEHIAHAKECLDSKQ